jgi:hypothetical protein
LPNSVSQFLGLRQSSFFCVNLRSIAVAFPKPENLNGTQIKSDATHTLISADQAYSGLWGYLRKSRISLHKAINKVPSLNFFHL